MAWDSDFAGCEIDSDTRCFLVGGFHAGLVYGDPAVGIALLSSCGIELSSMFIHGSKMSGEGIGNGLEGTTAIGDEEPMPSFTGLVLQTPSGDLEDFAV